MIYYRDFSQGLEYSGFSMTLDQVPDPIPDHNVEGVNFGVWTEFDAFQVTGIDAAIVTSITGGEFRVSRDLRNYDEFSDQDRSVEPGAWIEVRVRSEVLPEQGSSAVLSLGSVVVNFSVTTWDGIYQRAKELLKVSRSNDLVFLHDGNDIPVTAPKHPRSRIFKGFSIKGMAEGERVISHSFLINDREVDPGDEVDGMVFHVSRTDGEAEVKAELSGGLEGKEYLLTLNYSTQYVPSDFRSQKFMVKVL